MRQNWKPQCGVTYNSVQCRLAAKSFQTLMSGLMAGLQELGVHLSLIIVILRMSMC
jgi:hypothetical protein